MLKALPEYPHYDKKKATSIMKQPFRLKFTVELNLNEFSFGCVPFVQQYIKSKC